jgi:hypothetical protein
MNHLHTDVDVGGSMRRVRSRIEQGMRLLAEVNQTLPVHDELSSVPLSRTEAERVDRYCLNVEVALDDLSRWMRLLSLQAGELASRCGHPVAPYAPRAPFATYEAAGAGGGAAQ